MNLDRNVALAYVARDFDRAKESLVKRRVEAARMLSERQVQKESRARGGLLLQFDALIESATEAPSAHSHVSSS